MKLKPAFKEAGLLLLATASLTSSSHGARPSPLRYQPVPGQSNVYQVQIEIRDDTGTNTLSGNVMVVPNRTSSNVITVSFRGSLIPKREGGMMRGPMPIGYPRWSSPITLREGWDITIDERGRVLRSGFDSPLPAPLGSVAQLLIVPLPAGDAKRSEITEQLGVMDEPIAVGPVRAFLSNPGSPMPFYGFDSRQSIAVFPGIRVTKYETDLGNVAGAEIKLNSSFVTDLRTGNEPRVRGSVEGRLLLDRETGFLRQSDLRFESSSETETLTRRGSGVIRIKLLAGEQLVAALATNFVSAPAPPRSLSPADVQKALQEVKSGDDSVRRSAVHRLQNAQLTEVPGELLKLAETWVIAEDMSSKIAGAQILANHGTTEQVPILLKLLKQGENVNRYSIVQGLGRLKDPRAIEPLVDSIARGSDTYQVIEALGKFGPEAEEQVLQLLKQRHLETRRAACNILKQIGTSKSLEPIKALMLDPDQSLSSTAGEAFRAIQARE